MSLPDNSEYNFAEFTSKPSSTPVPKGLSRRGWGVAIVLILSVGLAAGVAYWMQPTRLDPSTPRLVLQVDGMH